MRPQVGVAENPRTRRYRSLQTVDLSCTLVGRLPTSVADECQSWRHCMLVSTKHMRRHLHAMSCWLIIDFSSMRIVVISFPIRNLRSFIAERCLTKQSTRLHCSLYPPRVLSVSFNKRLRMPLTGSRNAVAAVVPCTPDFESELQDIQQLYDSDR